MKKIYEKIQGDTTIDSDTELYGMIVGNVTVEKSVNFIIHGMIIGDLINNGKTEVYGTIDGQVTDNNNSLNIDVNAVIKN